MDHVHSSRADPGMVIGNRRPDPGTPERRPALETTMTETEPMDTMTSEPINEALAVIDRSLAELLNRELVSTDEVADLLLDVRSLLTKDSVPAPN
jgi:hypothetical protein